MSTKICRILNRLKLQRQGLIKPSYSNCPTSRVPLSVAELLHAMPVPAISAGRPITLTSATALLARSSAADWSLFRRVFEEEKFENIETPN